MHRSRIGLVLIDHPADAWDDALAFWAGVQGVQPVVEDPDQPEYRNVGRIGGLPLESQRTGAGTPARIHLDVETDDVPAEVDRLVGLGAEVVEPREGWTVMRDPGGLVFCVVPVQDRIAFDEAARTW